VGVGVPPVFVLVVIEPPPQPASESPMEVTAETKNNP
jgi:hypothetical protein